MSAAGKRPTVFWLATLVAAMLVLTAASVPFYRWFCAVTGYGGTTTVADSGSARVLDQTIDIRFDGSILSGMPWDFHPVVNKMTLRIGETGLAFYEATNVASVTTAGTATFNVLPYEAGSYFTKIECFCFSIQVLKPGESVQMPVTFYVDPAIVDDPDLQGLREITLSYTFATTDLPQEQVSLEPGASIPDKTTVN
jgi:cytochrome c oxidase assembly protein subunit 11